MFVEDRGVLNTARMKRFRQCEERIAATLPGLLGKGNCEL